MKNSENEALTLNEGDCMGLFFALVNISHLLRQACPPDTESVERPRRDKHHQIRKQGIGVVILGSFWLTKFS